MAKDKITFGLPEKIEKMMLDGASVAKCKKLLKEYPEYQDKSPKELQEILSTAHTYLTAEKSARSFENDFEYYRLSPIPDEKLCDKCKGLASMKFKFSERVPGKNFPPLHKGCRCTFETVVDDWDKWINDYATNHKK